MRESLGVIRAAPHSADALSLYALVSTLEFEQAGCLFKLDKLRDMTPAARLLAYRLMDLMVERQNGNQEWCAIKQEMDTIIRSA